MTVWRFVVPATNMGERTVPAPNDPSGTGQALIRKSGTWVHEKDWPYIKSLQFPCRGVMKDGFMKGCPDVNQMATRPPEPLPPPPAFYRSYVEPEVIELPKETQAREPRVRRKKKQED